MGGTEDCVDAAIHRKIDELNGKSDYLNKKI